jgi:hypothetical protein
VEASMMAVANFEYSTFAVVMIGAALLLFRLLRGYRMRSRGE